MRSTALSFVLASIIVTVGGCTIDPGPMPSDGSGGEPAPTCACTVVASSRNNPTWLAVDATTVYWIDEGVSVDGAFVDGRILAQPTTGGAMTTLASEQPTPEQLAVDDANVYWLVRGTAKASYADGAVMTVPKGGGAPAPIVTGLSRPKLFAVDAASVYWIADGRTLERADKDGSDRSTLATLRSATALAADDTGVYVIDGVQLERVATDGSGTTSIATLDALRGVSSIALDATSVYWTYRGTYEAPSSVVQVGKDGSGVVVLASATPQDQGSMLSPDFSPQSIAVDGAHVYWTILDDSSRAELLSVPIGGGASSIVYSTRYGMRTCGFVASGPGGVFATRPDSTPQALNGNGDVVRIVP